MRGQPVMFLERSSSKLIYIGQSLRSRKFHVGSSSALWSHSIGVNKSVLPSVL